MLNTSEFAFQARNNDDGQLQKCNIVAPPLSHALEQHARIPLDPSTAVGKSNAFALEITKI